MTGTSLINYEELAKTDMAVLAERERQSTAGQFLSTRGGIFRVGENEVPGNQLAVVIVDSIRENTYYPDRYNPDLNLPPICYAVERGNGPMFPHLESMSKDMSYFMPQHFKDGAPAGCDGCPMAEWGTSNTGRGKACSNRRRLALLPGGVFTRERGQRDWSCDLYTEPKHYEAADIAFLKLPVTSVAAYGKYVQQLVGAGLPEWGAVTRIWIEPDPKTQFRICFEQIDRLPTEIMATVAQRVQAARAVPLQGYDPPDEETKAKLANGRFATGRR